MFGSPRVFAYTGYQVVKRLLDPLIIRVTHYNDIVPRVPFTIMDYRHVGTEIHYPIFNTWNAYKTCQDLGTAESPGCINMVGSLGVHSHLVYLNVNVSKKCGYLLYGLDELTYVFGE